ncbi:retron Ec67 family RNA-directed DNA polymerase/endonuclease [Vreelandella sulfidaeris]|uniref:retron Ec67 family RNA-directed DNA polymerase/endonuclease n=1 Tax=Vreelandella sulfidaeris TaxID=115553 RepID=UPI0035ECB956
MSTLKKLKSASDIHDLAYLLNFKASNIAYIIYKLKEEEKYHNFEIPKSTGGLRNISAPESRLKNLQSNLANLLQECVTEIDKTLQIKNTASQAFQPKKSIITNASYHRKKRFLFNIDIEDYFGAINFGRVRGFFIKNKNFELDPKIATLIAQIACYRNKLPQGSPASPIISNLISHILDMRLIELSAKNKCFYTRYADDITFSTNLAEFPQEIAFESEEKIWSPSKKIIKLISKNGFNINYQKVRMQLEFSRQEVTGLTTNKIINTPIEYRKNARAMVRSLIMKGSFHMPKEEKEASLEQLHGILSFIDHVKLVTKHGHRNDLHSQPEAKEKKSSFEKDFSYFLFYKYCYAPTKPLVICEGKTDNIYLKCAIKSLILKYPKLIHQSNEKNLKIDFFKYSRSQGGDSQKGRLLELRGGEGNLKNFISTYEKNCEKIRAPGKLHPVIILIDNDEGGKKILSLIKKLKKTATQVTGNQDYYFINNNLYVVAIPDIMGNQSTSIEDFFYKKTLNKKLNGRVFNRKNDHSGQKFYGKYEFAQKIVQKDFNNINFRKFTKILDRIELVINDYKMRPHK